MKAHRLFSSIAVAASLAAPSCFFDADDDDDDDADTCLVECDDSHTECTTACSDDACITSCDDVRTDCEVDCD